VSNFVAEASDPCSRKGHDADPDEKEAAEPEGADAQHEETDHANRPADDPKPLTKPKQDALATGPNPGRVVPCRTIRRSQIVKKLGSASLP
jgi:hypothetical protein